MRKQLVGGSGLTSLLADAMIGDWRPRRIALAGVRFQSGGDEAKAAADKAAAEKATTDAAAAKAAADAEAAKKGKTPEQLAAEKKTADEATAAASKKAADDKAAADLAAKNAKDKEDADRQSKVPDKYELAVPDEAKAAIGDAVTDIQADVEADAKANGWTNEEAQAELVARLERGADRLTALRDKWLTDTKADTTYGGEKLEETQMLARKAVNALRPEGHARRDSFLRLLNGSGIGNNLEVVSFLADLGRLMGEDAPNLGKIGDKTPPVKGDADVLFPSSAAKP